MFRYKLKEADVSKVKKYLRTKKGRLQLPPWGVRFEKDLKLKGGDLFFKDKQVVPLEKWEDYLRKKLYAKDAELNTSRDAAFYQLQKECIGVSRRNIMAFLRAQKTLEARAALPKPKRVGGRKLKRVTFETDLCFIRKADVVRAQPRLKDRHGHNLVYCVTTVEKTTGLCRLGYSKFKDQKLVTPIVIEHIKSLCKTLGVKPKDCDLESDKGTEFGKEALGNIVNEYRYVGMGPSVEKKNQQLQKRIYEVLKMKQALTVEGAIQKAENLCNKTYGTVHKKTPEEVGELVKKKELDSVKDYNKARKSHVSNSKRKELQVGDHVRVLIATVKDKGIGFKQYKGLTYTKEVFVVVDRTQKKKRTAKQIKYRVEQLSYKKGQPFKGKWYTVDKLLKSALRDTKSKALIKKRTEEQDKADKAHGKAEDARVKKEIEKNRKRLLKLRDEGVRVVPSVNLGIKNLKNIKIMQEKNARIEELINELQQEYVEEVEAQGLKIAEEEPAALQWEGAQVRDPAYDPIADVADLDDEEEKAPEPKKRKRKPRKKKDAKAKERRRLIDAYKNKGNELLALQKKGFEGADFEAKILKFNDVKNEGKELAKVIRAKKFKHRLNIGFFDQ